MKKIISIFIFLAISLVSLGQDQLLNIAKEYYRNGEYDKAADTYKQLLEYQPKNNDIFLGYYNSLLELNRTKEAEKIVAKRIKANKTEKSNYLLLAKLYKKQDDKKKLKKTIKKYVDGVGQNSITAQRMAKELENEGFVQEALDLYLLSKKKNKEDPYLFAEDLALLYSKMGQEEKAAESLLDLYVVEKRKAESIKATLQQMYTSKEAMNALKKKVLKRSTKEPDNIAYYDLLSWIYIQQDDYESAFRQIKSIDVRLSEDGRRVLGYARTCLREKKYKAALKSYDFVISKEGSPYISLAQSEKLTTLKEQLIHKPNYTAEDVKAVSDFYGSFLAENQRFKASQTVREYADLLARYQNNLPKAIEVLQEVVDMPRADKLLKGRCKLDMGDYELLRGNVWESTLLYSQVDKAFKEDMLGEEAQFRNAKLTFYRGDFKYAQMQLDILKASTTELISNDAIDLSVLITENNPIKDSDDTPLRIFAQADLLIYQNKFKEGLHYLDSLAAEYPSHPLLDNILMKRSEIAMGKREYNEAALYLQKIIDQHGEDVLADDALYQLAMINEEHFNNKDEAKRLFEKLILDYPGSTFAERARKNFRRLRGDVLGES